MIMIYHLKSTWRACFFICCLPVIGTAKPEGCGHFATND